jgi:hypothetical protein
MIGKWTSTALITARTAAIRDGGQSKDASAGDAAASASASRIAQIATLLTVSMLLVAGCGGSSQPGFRDPDRLAAGVRRVLEQRLMTQAPRQGSAQSATHVKRIDCRHVDGDRYVCSGVLGNGTPLDVDAVVTADGKDFRLP